MTTRRTGGRRDVAGPVRRGLGHRALAVAAVAVAVGVGGGLVLPGSVHAQQSPPGRTATQLQDRPQQRAADRQAMMARVQREYERHLIRELGLTGDQLRSLRAAVAEFHPPRAAIMRERRELAARLRGMGEAAGSEAEARQLLDRFRALRARELDLQRQEEERLLEFLSPTQLLQLHQVREAFAERIRRLESGAQMRRGSPPDGGSGPPGGRPDTGT
jgi:hypothetical protein